jgi:hypothetical protein
VLPIPRSPWPAIATTTGQRLCRQVLTSGCVWSLLVARILPNLPPVPSVTWDPCSNANVNLLKAALSTRWAVAITQLHPDGKRHTTHPSPNVRNAIIGDHTMLRDEWNAAAIEADEANEAMPYPGDWRAAQDWLIKFCGDGSWGTWQITAHDVELIDLPGHQQKLAPPKLSRQEQPVSGIAALVEKERRLISERAPPCLRRKSVVSR